MRTFYPRLDPQTPEANMQPGVCALGMMIKAPREGASKTRLVPPLTHREAARLSAAFLRDTAANIAEACAENSHAARTENPHAARTENSQGARAAHAVAVYTPAGAEGEFDGLLPRGFALLAQRGDSFGERLFHASADLLRLGYESCCLIDSDSPTLPRALLTVAVEELRRPGERLVLGAADDGGYYLIGMKRAHRRLFEDIAWSTSDVLPQTIERAREINLDVALLPAWYDVDDAAALRRLCVELFDAPSDDASGGIKSDAACYAAKLAPYPAPHTRAELARLLDAEGRARFLTEPGVSELAVERAGEKGGA